mmetsp:Transcript_32021/g.76038  ORF Transcript_32021/g.76038 Transcript_32021/m.76038 type:complete len:295 (-) Transcript_32021:1287-2171(-)
MSASTGVWRDEFLEGADVYRRCVDKRRGVDSLIAACGLDGALVAAVDRELRARHHLEVGAGESPDGPGHVVGRDLRLEEVAALVLVNREAVGSRAGLEDLLGPEAGVEHRIRVHRVHTHPELGELEAGNAAQLGERRLRHRVASHALPGRRRVLRPHDHHRGVDAELEVGDRRGEHALRGCQVDRHRPIPLIGVDVLDGRGLGEDPGVEHQHVHPPEAADASLEGLLDSLGVGQVARHAEKLRALEGVGGLRVDVKRHDARPCVHEQLRHRLPDPARPTGDDENLAIEILARPA